MRMGKHVTVSVNALSPSSTGTIPKLVIKPESFITNLGIDPLALSLMGTPHRHCWTTRVGFPIFVNRFPILVNLVSPPPNRATRRSTSLRMQRSVHKGNNVNNGD